MYPDKGIIYIKEEFPFDYHSSIAQSLGVYL